MTLYSHATLSSSKLDDEKLHLDVKCMIQEHG